MFKVIGSVSNVRPSKSEEAELMTTPTNGNIKLNTPGAAKVGVTNGDYAVIVSAQESEGAPVQLFIAKGTKGTEKGETPKRSNIGSVLAGKSGGSLLFSSENAYRQLDGNKEDKKVYSIGDGFETEYEGETRTFYKLELVRTEEKVARTKKA